MALHKLLALLFFCILFGTVGPSSAQSKEADKSAEKAKEPSRDRSMKKEMELQKQFTADRIPKKDLKAFEARAQQKIRDLAEYLEILSDSSYGEKIRERAKEQASKLFDREERKLKGIPSKNGKVRSGPVPSILDSIKASDEVRLKTSVKKVESSPFELKDDGTYVSELSFTLHIELFKAGSEKRILEEKLSMKGKSRLLKVTKSFGEEERKVWELFLGSLRASND